MSEEAHLREHLLELLHSGGAHAGFEDAVDGLPAHLRGQRAPGLPFSPWRLLEHMRLAQSDILEFSRNAEHVSPPWPEGYWPESDGPEDAAAWDASVERFISDRNALAAMVRDRKRPLLEPLAWGNGQTLAREVMLAADHTAYHVAQLIVVRRLLGCWKD